MEKADDKKEESEVDMWGTKSLKERKKERKKYETA